MDPALFLADLEERPAALTDLRQALSVEDVWRALPVRVERVLFLGMGSSTFAAGVAAARLRARGVEALAELASSELLPPPDPARLVIAISASGNSRETLNAVSRYVGHSPVIAVTNVVDSPLAERCDVTVGMHARPELGGVSCRSYTHTVALLLALESRLLGGHRDLSGLLNRTVAATEDLLARRTTWLPAVVEQLAGPGITAVVAPFRRLGNAQQGALMLREGPRRLAIAAETGEWSHVDVYLTKTQDYRMLLFPGSRYEPELLRWTRERDATVVVGGADLPETTDSVRYLHDEDDDVRLLTELLVAELVAADLWRAQN